MLAGAVSKGNEWRRVVESGTYHEQVISGVTAAAGTGFERFPRIEVWSSIRPHRPSNGAFQTGGAGNGRSHHSS